MYNNDYTGSGAHCYSIGVGAGSKVYAEGNAFDGATLGPDAGWTPTLVGRADPVTAVKALVPALAGAGRG